MDAVAVGSIVGVALYLGIMTYIGYRAFHRNIKGDVNDYYLAGRGLGTILLLGTLFGTWFSTFAFLGGPGTFYLTGVNWLLFGFFNSMGPILIWVFGSRIWALGRKYGFITPADMLAAYYDDSKGVRLLTAIIGIASLFPYATIQLSGISKAVEGVTGGVIPYSGGILLCVLGVALYAIYGGARGVVWTDVIQGFIFAVLLVLTAGLVIHWAGGWQTGWLNALNVRPENFVFDPARSGNYLTLLLLWTFGWVLTPHLWQRMYMARSPRVMATSMVLASALALWVVTFSGAIIGFLAIGIMPEIPPGFDTDALVPLLYNRFLPIGGIILVIATFAAGMSTLDSQLITSTSIFTLDFYRSILNPNADGFTLQRIGYFFQGVFAAGLVIFALLPAGQALLIPLASIGVGLCLLFLMPLIGALFWPRASTPAAFWSMLLGFLVMLTLQVGGWTTYLPGTWGPPFWGFVTSVVIFIAVSLVTPPVAYERQERFHGFLRETFYGKRSIPSREAPAAAQAAAPPPAGPSAT